MTTREAAQLLGISLRTVQLWVENGSLRAWKTAGKHRRIVRNSVEELLLQQQVVIDSTPKREIFNVVAVDDDPVQLNIYQACFSAWDFPIHLITAEDGFEGMIQIGRCKPDLVFVDLIMPGMDGFQMIRALNQQPELRHLQIVVVSALDKNDIAEHGGLPGNVLIWEKPISIDRIKTLLLKRLSDRP